MKTLSKSLFILAFFFFGINSAQAQEPAVNQSTYRTAIGLRGGGTSGLTIKHFFANHAAIEGIIDFWPHGIGATALYEKHVQAFNVPGFHWYYGGGGHLRVYPDGSWTKYRGRYYWSDNDPDGLALGIDGIVGLEYKIRPIPFAISLDLKPFLEVNTNGGVGGYIDPGLGIKVTF